jgi:hypothetical protein
MTTTNILSKTLTTAAILLLGGTASHAATFVNTGTGGAGELFIGFHATSGTGSGKSVVIDVGAVSSLSAASVGSIISLGSVGTDLGNTFGNTTGNFWYERTDLLWSAVAGVQSIVPSTSSDPTSTLYGSVSGTGVHPLTTTAYSRGTNSAQNGVAQSIISNMATGLGGFTAAGTGANSNIAIELSGDDNNYAAWMPGGLKVSGTGDTPFGGFGSPTASNFEQAFAPGQISLGVEGSLDVYRMYRSNVADPDASPTTGTGAGSYQFTLNIDQSGNIKALVLPVPEPAGIILLMIGGLCSLGIRRRGAVARAASAA